MRPLLSSEDYTSTEVFAREQEKLLTESWQFAGFVDDIPNDGDWSTIEVAGRSIIIQNDAGSYRAFLNVCSHRYSRICTVERGHGMLECPYHGWRYDQKGMPYAIPRKPRFADFTPERVCELALKQFSVGTWEKLIFVRLSATG